MKKKCLHFVCNAHKIFMLAVLLFSVSGSFATVTKYVVPSGGTGTGASWATAYNGYGGIRSAIAAGADTVYIASGTYNYDNGGSITLSTKGVYMQGSINPSTGVYDPMTTSSQTQIVATGTPTNVPQFMAVDVNVLCIFKGLSFNLGGYTVNGTNSPSTYSGQAFTCQGSGSSINVQFIDLFFTGCVGQTYGGAVYLSPGTSGAPFTSTSTSIIFKNCVFKGNTVGVPTDATGWGGAIYAAVSNGQAYSSSNLIIDGCGFNSNATTTTASGSGGAGGALYLIGGWNIKNSVFCGNLAAAPTGGSSGGGAISIASNSGTDVVTAVTNCNFSGNLAQVSGGMGARGGAIIMYTSTGTGLVCDRDSFYTNSADGSGGAPLSTPVSGASLYDLYVGSGAATVTNSRMQGTINTTFFNTTNYPNLVSVGSNTSIGNMTPYGGNCPTALTSSTPAGYDQIYVKMPADGGSDANGGTSWDDAYATVAKAVSALSTSRTNIYIASGTYADASGYTLSTAPKSLLMQGGFPKQSTGLVNQSTYNYQTQATIIDASSFSSADVFTYPNTMSGNTVTIKGISVQNLNKLGSGHLFNSQSDIGTAFNFVDDVFKNNKEYQGLTFESFGSAPLTLTVTNCSFEGNSATRAAAIRFAPGSVGSGTQPATISGCNFMNNTASGGDGTCISFESAGGNLQVLNSTFCSNTGTSSNGGAIFLTSVGPFTVNGCTFTSNSASADGGAIYMASGYYNSGVFTLQNSAFYNNSSSAYGGAIFSTNCPFVFKNLVFLGNHATNSPQGGGAIRFENNSSGNGSTLNQTTFANNYTGSSATNTTLQGSDVYSNGPTYTFTNDSLQLPGINSTNYPLATDGGGNNFNGNLSTDVPASTCSAVVLPVTLLTFTAAKNGNAADLAWSTAQEINFDHFEVQVLSASNVWNSITSIPSSNPNGNSSLVTDYSYIDPSAITEANNGIVQYRLKMVDLDGSFTYSTTVPVVFGTSTSINALPNPATSQVTVTGLSGSNELQLYDMVGKLVSRTTAQGTTGTVNVQGLASGMYFIKIVSTSNGSVVATKKIVKE